MNDDIERIKIFTNKFPDGIIFLDQQRRIQWWNHSAGRLFNLTQAHLNTPITTLIDNKRFLQALPEALQTMQEYITIKLPAAVDKTLHLRLLLINYEHNSAFLHIEDITPIQRLEQMRQDFVANVSHELRTPLTVIRGYLETLIEHNDPEMEKWSMIFEQMQQQTVRMENILEELLLLSRLETDQLRTSEQKLIDMADLLTTIQHDAISLSDDKAHDIQLQLETKARLYGNRRELHSAFSNLVYNAVHYTPPQQQIILRWYTDDDGGHFAVIDQGIGIETKHLPRITERFYRADKARSRARGGTGLGLAIVKHILIRHRAHLRINSTPGVGSEFICDFSPESVVA